MNRLSANLGINWQAEEFRGTLQLGARRALEGWLGVSFDRASPTGAKAANLSEREKIESVRKFAMKWKEKALNKSEAASDSGAGTHSVPMLRPKTSSPISRPVGDDFMMQWREKPSFWIKADDPDMEDLEGNTDFLQDLTAGSARTGHTGARVLKRQQTDITMEMLSDPNGLVQPEQQMPPGAKKKKKPRTPYFIYGMSIVHLVIVCVEVYINGGFQPFNLNPWGGPSTQVLLDMGAKYGPYMLPPKDDKYRFVTPMFLHVGFIHYFMNMSFQMNVGKDLEIEYGMLRIIPIYVIAGIGGNVASALFVPNRIQVGASGSLYGLMGCMLIDLFQNWTLLQKHKMKPGKILFQMIIQILISLAMGLLPGIDNFAHIGGMITGILAGIIFLPHINLNKRSAVFKLILALVAVIGLIIYFAVGLTQFYDQVDGAEWCHACTYLSCLSAVFNCEDF